VKRGDRGQSTVEFALVLPIIFVVLLGVVQAGVTIYAQIAVTHTAREVARALAVDPTADPAAIAAGATTLRPDHVEVDVSFAPSPAGTRQVVIVVVHYVVPAFAGVTSVAGEFTVSARASMLVES
jgi:Flp pilus assembly protein TadG